MQCFDTFRGYLHKLFAVKVDGNGREGTHSLMFFFTTTGGAAGRAQGAAAPAPDTSLAPPMCIAVGSVHVDADRAEYFVVADETVLHLIGTAFAGDEMSARQEQRLDGGTETSLTRRLHPHLLVLASDLLAARTQIHLVFDGTAAFQLVIGRQRIAFRGRVGSLAAVWVVQLADDGHRSDAFPVGDDDVAENADNCARSRHVHEPVIGDCRQRQIADLVRRNLKERVHPLHDRRPQFRIGGTCGRNVSSSICHS